MHAEMRFAETQVTEKCPKCGGPLAEQEAFTGYDSFGDECWTNILVCERCGVGFSIGEVPDAGAK